MAGREGNLIFRVIEQLSGLCAYRDSNAYLAENYMRAREGLRNARSYR